MAKKEEWNKEPLTRLVTDDEAEWRIMSAGLKRNGEPWAKIAPYLQSRAIMNRLDEAVGPENWTADYQQIEVAGSPAMECMLSLRINGEWIVKRDLAAIEIPDKGDHKIIDMCVKAAYSNAFKRAAVNWGPGRDLYTLKTVFAVVHKAGKNYGTFKEKNGKRHSFHWDAPPLEVVRKHVPEDDEPRVEPVHDETAEPEIFVNPPDCTANEKDRGCQLRWLQHYQNNPSVSLDNRTHCQRARANQPRKWTGAQIQKLIDACALDVEQSQKAAEEMTSDDLP